MSERKSMLSDRFAKAIRDLSDSPPDPSGSLESRVEALEKAIDGLLAENSRLWAALEGREE